MANDSTTSVLGFELVFDDPTPQVEEVTCADCGRVAQGYVRTSMTRDGETEASIQIARCIPCDAQRDT
jgi:uncharacterized Fe-S center protein